MNPAAVRWIRSPALETEADKATALETLPHRLYPTFGVRNPHPHAEQYARPGLSQAAGSLALRFKSACDA